MGTETSLRLITAIAATIALSMLAACGRATPATPAAARTVDITAADGVVLKGTLFGAPGGGPAVLLLHQCDDRRTVWDPLGPRLAAAGITALSIDYRGYGDSGGTPHEKLTTAEATAITTSSWPGDIDAAFAFLMKQPRVTMERAGAAGGSCGANNAVQLARRHTNVKALALLAGGTDRAGRLFLAGAAAPPVFAAAAADDEYGNFVQIMSWHFGASHRPESRFAQYQDGGHAAVVFRKHPELADALTSWFAAVLTNRPDALPTTNGVPLPPGVLDALQEVDQPGGAAAALQRRAAPLPELFVNQLGYEHMVMKDFPGAIELMKLNAATYPDSPNAQDSLGDVYLAAGDKASALAAAKRTLELLEKDSVDTPRAKAGIRAGAEAKLNLTSR